MTAREPTELAETWVAVSTWASTARHATSQRDRAIVAMREAGASLREIAQAAGMAHASIVRILERAPQ